MKKMKKILRLRGTHYTEDESHDYIENEYGERIIYCAECYNTPEDSVFSRDAHSSRTIIRLVKRLFEDVGLNFDDYYEIRDEIKDSDE